MLEQERRQPVVCQRQSYRNNNIMLITLKDSDKGNVDADSSRCAAFGLLPGDVITGTCLLCCLGKAKGHLSSPFFQLCHFVEWYFMHFN